VPRPSPAIKPTPATSSPLAVLPDGTAPTELYGRTVKKPFRTGRGGKQQVYSGKIVGHQVAPEGQILMRVTYDDGFDEYFGWMELQQLLTDEDISVMAAFEQTVYPQGGAGELQVAAARETTSYGSTSLHNRFAAPSKARRKAKHRSNESTFTDFKAALKAGQEITGAQLISRRSWRIC
jgi:hypothetical protein